MGGQAQKRHDTEAGKQASIVWIVSKQMSERVMNGTATNQNSG